MSIREDIAKIIGILDEKGLEELLEYAWWLQAEKVDLSPERRLELEKAKGEVIRGEVVPWRAIEGQKFQVEFSRRARRCYKRLDADMAAWLNEVLERLEQDPWGGDVQAVKGDPLTWWRRIGRPGSLLQRVGPRIVYRVNKQTRIVTVLLILSSDVRFALMPYIEDESEREKAMKALVEFLLPGK